MATLKTMRIYDTTIENARILRFLTGESTAAVLDRLVAIELGKIREEKKDKIGELLQTRTATERKKVGRKKK